MKIMAWLLAGLVAMGAASRAQDVYELDKTHMEIGFTISHLVISEVKGRFNDFAGTVTLGPDNVPLAAEAVIQAASIDTAVAKRDDHLRNEDFFHVEKYPTITFVGKKVEQEGERWVMVGDFTMHGVTKEIRLPFTITGPIRDPWGNTRIGIKAETTLNRKDYRLTWNKVLEAGGLAIGEIVKIHITGEAVKK
jgi:polyisoprenoid-binding protein YceI